MKQFGFQYETSNQPLLAQTAFDKRMKHISSINKNFVPLYKDLLDMTTRNLTFELLTNNGSPTNGHSFGYVTDDIAPDDFKDYQNPDGTPYDKDEDEKILGKYGNPRIIALDPAIYGGRYKKPFYTTEMRQFTGWIEVATKAFDSSYGCDPKKPPLISFSDISQRTKILGSTIRNDPRLTQDPECVTVNPFEFLADSKIIAKMDGVVRTTIRAYVSEYFLKGYGLFSNINVRDKNFDGSMMQYLIFTMKKEMSELGPDSASRKVRITRLRYWYTFLEQSCEAYMRMIDVDNLEPPDEVSEAINTIRKALDKFRVIGPNSKKQMRINLDAGQKPRKPKSLKEAREIVNDAYRTTLHAIAFRIEQFDDEEDSFFNNGEIDVSANDIRFASLKKLRFFQKIYFISLFEKEATLIMTELIKDEIRRFSEILVDGVNDKPLYYDLYRSFFGMSTFFPNSSSRVGLNSYYVDKQISEKPNAGNIPTVKNNNSVGPVEATDKPQLIVESYVTMSPKDTEDTPDFIRFRDESLSGKVSLNNFSNFLSVNSSALSEKKISDYFGDLSFTYKGSLKKLLDKGFANSESINQLITLNSDIPDEKFQNALGSFIAAVAFQDFEVVYDNSFVLEGETPEPFGVTGETGISYGLRLSLVLPKDFITGDDLQSFKDKNASRSRLEKCFYFNDGTIVLPLVTDEVAVVDAKFNNIEEYDLECLINKMVSNPEFTTMFDKILGLSRTSSMLAIYCMETFMPSLGRQEGEREEDLIVDDDDAWDGTINKFGKNFLRREFKSLYLSRTRDGQSIDVGDVTFGDVIGLGNPFDSFRMPAIRLPWWTKRRMKFKVFDENGQECADPKKDLR